MEQSNFSRDHFQFVLRQVEHRYAGLGKRCRGPCYELVVAEVQRSDVCQIAESMRQSTQ